MSNYVLIKKTHLTAAFTMIGFFGLGVGFYVGYQFKSVEFFAKSRIHSELCQSKYHDSYRSFDESGSPSCIQQSIKTGKWNHVSLATNHEGYIND